MRLKRSLFSLCDLYNLLRAKKIAAFKNEGKTLSRMDLRSTALQIRRNNNELKETYSQVVQNTADRVWVGFKNHFEGRARFPRSKKHSNYKSLTFPPAGFKLVGHVESQSGKRTEIRGKLHIFGIGDARIFLHRPLVGTIRRLTIKLDAGEWYAIFLLRKGDAKKQPISSIPEDRVRAGDLGLSKFITFDNATSMTRPKFLKQSEEKTRLLQRHISSKMIGSRRYRSLRFRLARLGLHTAMQRQDWQNKLVAKIFTEVDVLILEKLSLETMVRNNPLAKSLFEASFGKFARKATQKADQLGKHILFIDPWGTTQ
jgi:putative transposase